MAIYHCDVRTIGRNRGQSAVAAAAYCTASKLFDERASKLYDFSQKEGVEHCEIRLPKGVRADWAYDDAELWNAAERAEKRKDARVAREVVVSLPCELTRGQQISLASNFAQELANRFGCAVEVAIHRPTGKSDSRNMHAHILMTTRQVRETGLGDKTLIERSNTWLLANGQPTSIQQLRDIRQTWANHVNQRLIQAGLDVRVDHRSYSERGIEIRPTRKIGERAIRLARAGVRKPLARIGPHAASHNASLFRKKPEQVLSLITSEKSVFDTHDVARTINRYVDDAQAFHDAFAAVMSSPLLVQLQPEHKGNPARYSTREMIDLEHTLVSRAAQMKNRSGYRVEAGNVAAALGKHDQAIKAGAAASVRQAAMGEGLSDPLLGGGITAAGLSTEQRLAVEHITGSGHIAAVIGFAGAGKSTMLAAARDAWESQGFRVHGAALAGKAAEGLQESSGIVSRTLASWEYNWHQNKAELTRGDIFVIDEAGMLSSRQLAMFLAETNAKGAKLVLVGDHEQLQAIGAGSPFRAVVEEVGAVALSEIRRQKEGWQRDAAVAFATHRTAEGLASFDAHGDVRFHPDREIARSSLINDWVADRDQWPSASRVALAHRRSDVHAINLGIRTALKAKGDLAPDTDVGGPGAERIYKTRDGDRSFAPGDRILLLENNRDLGVKNGMLGTVVTLDANWIHARLDSNGQNGGRVVDIPVKQYHAFDHGYATTIHKAQGSTVDRAYIMASRTMDRHLTYVAMTRHRDQARLYVGADEIKDMKGLIFNLARSGAKETTLDYTQRFGQRRGLAEPIGLRHEEAVIARRQSDRDMSASLLGEQERRGYKVSGETDSIHPPVNAIEKTTPLIPSVKSYSQDIEAIAREKAIPELERDLDVVREVSRLVYKDPVGFTDIVAGAIRDGTADSTALARFVAERPQQLGELRGKSGIFGDNAERRRAHTVSKALASHVSMAAETWQRRLEAGRSQEIWQREKLDQIEVPGLTPGSEEILKALDALPQAEQKDALETMATTPEGRQALLEAKNMNRALKERFGSSDPRDLREHSMRLGPEVAASIDRIKGVAWISHRAEYAELNRQYELTRSLSKSLGLGM